MEPIDYEKYVVNNRGDMEKDPLKPVLLFPPDDIELAEIAKKISTVEPTKPEIEAELDLHVNECLRSYNSNFIYLAKNYNKYSTYNLTQLKRHEFLKLAKTAEIQEFESNYGMDGPGSHSDPSSQQQRSSWVLSDLEKLEPDPIMSHLFERNDSGPGETENTENHAFKPATASPNSAIFAFYPSQPHVEQVFVEARGSFDPPHETLSRLQASRVLVKCNHLRLDLDIEPLWAHAALYDLKERRKVSENFSFDLNTDQHKQMLHTHQTHQDLSTQARSCILNITYPSNDLFLVIRIEKVLQQGDISECAEPYVKAQQQSASGIEKLQLNSNQFCERLGKYRMPFAWTAINLTSILTSSNTSANMCNNMVDFDEISSSKSSSLDNQSRKGNQTTKNAYESFRKSVINDAALRNKSNMDESLSLSASLAQFKHIAITINTFFKQESDKLSDEDLYRCLNELKKSTNLIKKLKCIPGCLKMEFSPFTYDFASTTTDHTLLPGHLSNHFILSPELQLLKFPTNILLAGGSTGQGDKHHYHQSLLKHNHLLPIKDVLEFPSYNLYEPNSCYRNLLYIYPLAINLCGAGQARMGNSSGSTPASSVSMGSNLTGPGSNLASSLASSANSSSSLLNQSSARNIAVKVNFMKGEEDHCALPILFSKHSSTQEYCKEVFVNVVYHNKTPQYHDEVKIKLPALLNDANYHLLFTFYHISCQNSKDQNQLETVIGYSWLPLKQQFQYETTVYFTNNMTNGSSSSMPAMNLNQPGSNLNTGSSSMDPMSGQQGKIGMFSSKNKCSMIKSGIYSLPISFEKLPPGYSNLNYSIYDSSSNNSVSFFLPNSEQSSTLDNLGADSSTMTIKDELRVPLSNIISVNTNLSNLNHNSSLNTAANISGNAVVNSSASSLMMSSGSTPLVAGLNSNSKSFFDVRLKLVSSVHTQDVYLERFISIANMYSANYTATNSNSQPTSNTNDILLSQAIRDLCYVELEALCKFLFVILDKLFYLMLNSSLSTLCFEITTRLVHKVTSLLSGQNDVHRRNRLLVQYVKYTCNLPYTTPMFLFHEELLSEWMLFLTKKVPAPSPDARAQTAASPIDLASFKEILLQMSWFYFDLLIKSVATYLNLKTNCLNKMFYFQQQQNIHQMLHNTKQTLQSFCTRQLSQKFLAGLDKLTKILITELVHQVPKVSSEPPASNTEKTCSTTSLLNSSIGFFLNDLVSVCDRGLVFKQVDFYFKEVNKCLTMLKNNTKTSSLTYKQSTKKFNAMQVDFLRILSSHEHFLALNLPLFSELNDLASKLPALWNKSSGGQMSWSSAATANTRPVKLIIESKDYFSKHYLIGLVMRKTFKSLHSPFTSIQYKSVELIRNLLESHDLDPRLNSSKQAANQQLVKARIAYMYFPLVNLIIHFIPFMLASMSHPSSKSCAEFDDDPSLLNDSDAFLLDDVYLNDYDINILIDKINDIDNGYVSYFDTNYGNSGSLGGLSGSFGMTSNIDMAEGDDQCDIDESEYTNESQPPIDTKSKSKRGGYNLTGKKSESKSIQEQLKEVKQPSVSAESQQASSQWAKQTTACICSNLIFKKNFKIANFSLRTTQDLLICFMWILKNMDKKLLFYIWSNWSLNKLNKILILIDLCINHFEYRSTVWSNTMSSQADKTAAQSSSNTAKKQMNTTSSGQTNFSSIYGSNNNKIKSKLEDLIVGTQTVRNELLKKVNKVDEAVTTSSSADSTTTSGDVATKFFNKWRNKDQKATSVNTTTAGQVASEHDQESNSSQNNLIDHLKLVLEGNLSTEVVLISLDTIDLIIKLIQQQQYHQQQHLTLTAQNLIAPTNILFTSNYLSPSSNTNTATHTGSSLSSSSSSNSSLIVTDMSQSMLLTNIMKILLNALNLEQSTNSLTNIFSHQRVLVTKFPELLFEEDTEYCADMCMRLLKHCTSPLQTVRSQASASLYFLMRQNFDIGNNFARVKMQVTMSLSTLVAGTKMSQNGSNGSAGIVTAPLSSQSTQTTTLMDFFSVNCLKRALKTILYYAESDIELAESSFPAQVRDLVLNLNTILSDTVKMREFNDDPEMLIDLMHRIANCYQTSPDMRLIWLQNMAQKHLQMQQLVEAGQCLIHAAALIAEYLAMIENKSYLPVGCANFKSVSVNVLEESAVSDDVLASPPYEEGICTGKYFSETGLIGLIEQAAVFLMHAQHYETVNQLYKILIPIYEAHHDIKKLAQVHSKLHDCFNKILVNNQRRLFGTYFRVGFYGEYFEDLNGEEFIYKEPGITKLAEIASRLESFYTRKFGPGCVEILKDSNNVDKSQLDLVAKCYIQITYVEPYFDRWELQKCESFFEKNHSLKRFIYSTPFTLDGKAHGPLNQQYKRKTILTTERAFPYVKTRIPVIDKQQIILGPVEVAVEDLQKKIDELKLATAQEPPDPKILQMVLQGCVGTTVNQGPLEMAMTFLQPVSSESITEHHNKLRLCFKEFSRRCADALKKNKNLIGNDQLEYQKEMERNYTELKIRIDPLIENKIFKSISFVKKPIEH